MGRAQLHADVFRFTASYGICTFFFLLFLVGDYSFEIYLRDESVHRWYN